MDVPGPVMQPFSCCSVIMPLSQTLASLPDPPPSAVVGAIDFGPSQGVPKVITSPQSPSQSHSLFCSLHCEAFGAHRGIGQQQQDDRRRVPPRHVVPGALRKGLSHEFRRGPRR